MKADGGFPSNIIDTGEYSGCWAAEFTNRQSWSHQDPDRRRTKPKQSRLDQALTYSRHSSCARDRCLYNVCATLFPLNLPDTSLFHFYLYFTIFELLQGEGAQAQRDPMFSSLDSLKFINYKVAVKLRKSEAARNRNSLSVSNSLLLGFIYNNSHFADNQKCDIPIHIHNTSHPDTLTLNSQISILFPSYYNL